MSKIYKRIIILFLCMFLIESSLNNSSNTKFNLDETSITLLTSLRGGSKKYPSNFDKDVYRLLRKKFPDSEKRIEFEKSKLEFYKSARSKFYIYGNPALGIKDKMKLLTPEEEDAVNYFTGQGFYSYEQNFKTEPNIFDTRESFLIKMHDESNRKRFLKSLD